MLPVAMPAFISTSPAGGKTSVLDFGVRGDGIADDSENLQRAITQGPATLVIP
jgi:polygalacturonase